MSNQEIMGWALPAMAIGASLVAWFTISRTKGLFRVAFATFFSGFGIALIGAAVAVYLDRIELGLRIALLGGIACFAGMVVLWLSKASGDDSTAT